MSNNNQNLRSEAEELVNELEAINFIDHAQIQNNKSDEDNISVMVRHIEGVSYSEGVVENKLENNDTFNIINLHTPTFRQNWWEFDMKPA